VPWYRDNNYPIIANRIMEYGLSFSQYSYSLPKPLSDLYCLWMQVNYGDYFTALGFSASYYDPASNRFGADDIKERIDEIAAAWKAKYPKLEFKTNMLRFDNLVNFNQTFTTEIAELNFDA
jgi:hypothetical protein